MAKSKLWPKQLSLVYLNSLHANLIFEPLSVVMQLVSLHQDPIHQESPAMILLNSLPCDPLLYNEYTNKHFVIATQVLCSGLCSLEMDP